MDRNLKFAIIGGGPRGISVVEQLVIECAGGESTVSIDLIDDHIPGAGRVWNPMQSQDLLMNTHAREVTIYSGSPDGGPSRAGSGPSLEEWIAEEGEKISEDGYAPRALYGKYLKNAFEKISKNAPAGIEVRGIVDQVEDIQTQEDGYRLICSTRNLGSYHSVILATGHPRQPVSPIIDQSMGRVIAGDSAADLNLSHIKPGSTVATIGMGLSFHDVVALLTSGRGGKFQEVNGNLKYIPSGKEPQIIGVSRSGLPIPSRGINQKAADHSFSPIICTPERMSQLCALTHSNFMTDVEPWIMAEAAISFTKASLQSSAPQSIDNFLQLASKIDSNPLETVHALARSFGVMNQLPTLYSMARPFQEENFQSFEEWNSTIREHLQRDTAMAREGNVKNPTKAALDTLRDLRPAIRLAVENGRLEPESHQKDFLGKFVPTYSLLVAGPPVIRNTQLLALLSSGIVKIAPPGTRIHENSEGKFTLQSANAPWIHTAENIIDARIPGYSIGTCRSKLYPNILSRGLVRRFRHEGKTSAIETGACESDPQTGHTIGIDGRPVKGLFVIGIPTERQRWFTQIGNGRPGVDSSFTSEARKIARYALVDALGKTEKIEVPS